MKRLFKYCILPAFFLAVHTAEGQEIKKWKLKDLSAAIQNAEGPTIFNFWATFCKPCIEELPYFQEAAKKYEQQGVKLILVNLDLPEAISKIRPFALKRQITAPIVFLDETNADLFCPAVDESWSGAIPATLLINNKTGYRKFFEESLKKAVLEREIQSMTGIQNN